MGTWATFVLARTATPLDSFTPLTERDEGLVADQAFAEGWHLGQYEDSYLFDERADVLPDLHRLTSAPTIIAFVADSDYALVEGLDGHGRFRVCIGYLAAAEEAETAGPDWEGYVPNPEVEGAVLAWAEAAGLFPSREKISNILARTEAVDIEGDWTPAELVLMELCRALGLQVESDTAAG
ncbi:MAG TPA: hypothetical protein VMB79_11415 [Jatrophihabitans sp.]|nr:hypothetical protein [Jatrophihabitans sp.]